MWTKNTGQASFSQAARKFELAWRHVSKFTFQTIYIWNNSPIHFVFDHVFNSSHLTLSINMLVNILKYTIHIEIQVYKIHIPYTL